MLQDITFLGHSSRQKAPPVVWDRQAASRTEIVFWFQFRFWILRLLIGQRHHFWGAKSSPHWHHVTFNYENQKAFSCSQSVEHVQKAQCFWKLIFPWIFSLKHNSSMIQLAYDWFSNQQRCQQQDHIQSFAVASLVLPLQYRRIENWADSTLTLSKILKPTSSTKSWYQVLVIPKITWI